jgi:hypothetical protein
MTRHTMQWRTLGVAGVVICLELTACHRQSAAPPVDGGIYSIVSSPEKRTFGVVKVLKVEPGAVHVRVYGGEYAARPTSVNPGELKVGTIDEGGMGHLPLSPRVFAAWKPVLITKSPVEPAELDGYEEWRKAGGRVWDQ